LTENNDDSFSSSKAEVFEALGHPTRIRILQELAAKPLTYSELKRAAGMESNGLLTFHLGKMRDLVRLNPEGNYALTDEGKEALRIVEASRKQPEGPSGQRPALHLPHQKAILAGLLVALIVLGSVAVYQEEQIGTLNHEISSDTVTINGVEYRYLSVPLQSVFDAKSIVFEGVNFTEMFPNLGQNYSGEITEYNVTNVSHYPPPNSNATQQILIGLPEIAVTSGTGPVEYWNPFTVTVDTNFTGHAYITYTQPPNGIWFTRQTSPSAGIEWNSGSDLITCYVSVK
jgi:DNA-binding transcriptional ArsR family regulator